MLQKMRGKAASFVAKILGFLLILSFGAWGIADYLRPQGAPTYVAEVSDQTIGVNEFNDQYRREVSRLSSMLGTQVDAEQARRFGIADSTLERMISSRLVAIETHRMGLVVGDDEVRRAILDQRGFRNSLGQFDPAVFKRVLNENGLTEDRYVELLRSDLARQHLTGVILAAVPPKQLTDGLFRYRGERRTADVVLVPRGTPESMKDPDEATLAEYHKANSAQFMTPEVRDLTVTYFDPNEMASQMKPTDDQIRDEFEHRRNSFDVPERRTVRQIVAADEETAKRASAALKQGGDFTKTAQDVAGRSEEATRLGNVARKDLPTELAEVAFKLEPNVASEPVQSPLGWHVLLVDKIEPGKTATLEETKPQLIREISHDMAVDAIVRNAHKFEDTLAGGASLEEAATEFGARLIKIEGVDVAGRGKDGTPKQGIPKARKFFETAFSTGAKETSLLTETGDGGMFVVRVDAIAPSAVRPLEEVRAQAVSAWKRAQLDEAARARAAAVRDQVRGGANLRTVAAAEKFEVATSKPFTRLDLDPDSPVPPSLVGELFKLPKGGVETGPSEAGYAVAQVSEITPADPDSDKARLKQFSDQLRESLIEDLLTEFTAALRNEHRVSINQRALERFYTEGRN